jgi:hypothetical protein
MLEGELLGNKHVGGNDNNNGQIQTITSCKSRIAVNKELVGNNIPSNQKP